MATDNVYGIRSGKELREINEERQTGLIPELERPVISKAAAKEAAARDSYIRAQGMNPNLLTGDPSTDLGTYMLMRSMDEPVARSYMGTDQGGFGQSKYDFLSGRHDDGHDLEHYRALSQSFGTKVANGAVKMGTTALSTAANTVAGTVMGALTGVWDLATQPFDQESPMRTGNLPDVIPHAFRAGVNNGVSEFLNDFITYMDEAVPNFRTEEERSEKYQQEWYRHIFTGNFIGDSLLKNFGFSLGAVGAGALTSNMLSKIGALKYTGDIMKGATAAASGEEAAVKGMDEAMRLLKTAGGDLSKVPWDKVRSALGNAAGAYLRTTGLRQIAGATVSASGEASSEGIMAANEWLEDYLPRLEQQFIDDYEAAETDVLRGVAEGWAVPTGRYDKDGKPVMTLTGDGNGELARRRLELMDKYDAARQKAAEEADALASATFLMNLPILLTSDLVQFGKLYSGGYKRTAAAKTKVRGGIDYRGGSPHADYDKVGNKFWGSVGRTAKVAGVEGGQELLQGAVSSGRKNVADARLTAFTDDGYDGKSLSSLGGWFSGMIEGAFDYLTDPASMQEAFLGAVTGVLGMPGKPWHGGIPEAIREARGSVRQSTDAAGKLNEYVNGERYQKLLRDYVRHLKYDDEMEESAKHKDEYAYHTASKKDLVNMVKMFDDAGRLNDLEELIDHYASLSDDEVKEVRELLRGDQAFPEDVLARMKDSDIRELVEKRAKQVKDEIEEYRKLYDDLRVRLPEGADDDMLAEMLYTAEMVNGFERRFIDMYAQVMRAVEPLLEQVAAVDGEGKRVSEEEKVAKLREFMNAASRSFSGNVVPGAWSESYRKAIDRNLDLLQSLAGAANNPAVQQQIKDMRKVVRDREAFYFKLDRLQSLPAEVFNSERKTQEKEQAKAERKAFKDTVDSFGSVSDVKDAVNAIPPDRQDAYVRELRDKHKDNPHVKGFVDLWDTYRGIATQVRNDSVKEDSAPGRTPSNSGDVFQMLKGRVINNLWRLAQSPEDLLDPSTLLKENEGQLLDMIQRTTQAMFSFGRDPRAMAEILYNEILKSIDHSLSAYADLQGKTAGITKLAELLRNAPAGKNPMEGMGLAAFPGAVHGSAGPDGSHGGTPAASPQGPTPSPSPAPPTPPTPQPPAKADRDGLVDDVVKAYDSSGKPGLDSQAQSKQYDYLHTVIPELPVNVAKAYRNALDMTDQEARKKELMNIETGKTLWETKPEFKDIGDYLVSHGAFGAMATKVYPGRSLHILIDPSCPTYENKNNPDDKYNMLLAVKEPDGSFQVIGVLPRTDRYSGLGELRKAVIKEYDAHKIDHPTDPFVFSKSTVVHTKMQGIIDYDFTVKGDNWKSDRPLTDIEGYSGKALVARRTKDGWEVLAGDPADVGQRFAQNSPELAKYAIGNFDGKPGATYYFAENVGCPSLPIRVSAARFNKANSGSNDAMFNEVNGCIDRIASVANDAVNGAISAEPGMSVEKIANASISDLMKKLGDVLYIRDIYIDMVRSKDNALLLKLEEKEDKTIGRNERTKFVSVSDPNVDVAEQVREFLIEADRPLAMESRNYADLLSRGLVTSNARHLRPVNADFRFPLWDARAGRFQPLTAEQRVSIDRYSKEGSPGEAQVKRNTGADSGSASIPVQGPSPMSPSPSPAGAGAAVGGTATAPAPGSGSQASSTTATSAGPVSPESPASAQTASPTAPSSAQASAPEQTPALPTAGTDSGASDASGLPDALSWMDDMPFQIAEPVSPLSEQEASGIVRESREKNRGRAYRVSADLRKLFGGSMSMTNMRMSESKLRDRLRRLGVSGQVIDFLTRGIKEHPELKDMSPYEAFTQLTRLMYYDMREEYDRAIGRKVDDALESRLMDLARQLGIGVRFADLRRITEEYGAVAMYDVMEKVIWLSENRDSRNAATLPEEFAHGFVELMGASTAYGADTADYKFLDATVTDTSIYEEVVRKYGNVYRNADGTPDLERLRKEAIGQALAAAIVHNWDLRRMGVKEKEKSFWNQLKDWFNRILDTIRGSGVRVSFEQVIDDIAKEVLDGDFSRLDKLDGSGYRLLDYVETLEEQTRRDGGKALGFLRFFTELGNIITGSLAYRRQGTVYRGKLDSLHDIDMVVPPEAHGADLAALLSKYTGNVNRNPDFVADVHSLPYFDKVREKYPGIKFASAFTDGGNITVNAVYSEDEELAERFTRLTGSYADRLGNFTEEERGKLYLFDFFLYGGPYKDGSVYDPAYGIRLTNWKHSMREKLKMGRAKDLYDYRMFKVFDEYASSAPNPEDLLFQSTSVDWQERAVSERLGAVKEATGFPDDVARVVTVIAAQGGDRVDSTLGALRVMSRSGSSMEEDAAAFAAVFNAVSTSTEKMELARAVSDIYGVPSGEVDMLRVMTDWNVWRLSGVMPKGPKAAVDALRRAFDRIGLIDDNIDVVAGSMSTVSRTVGMASPRYDTDGDIGTVPSLDRFGSMPDYVRERLEASGISAAEYDGAPQALKDKMLKCAIG